MSRRYEAERLQREEKRRWERYSKCKECGVIMECIRKPIEERPAGILFAYTGVMLWIWGIINWIAAIMLLEALDYVSLGAIIGFFLDIAYTGIGILLYRLGLLMIRKPGEVWFCRTCGNRIELP